MHRENNQDPEKKKFAEELLAYCESFNGAFYQNLFAKGDVSEEVGEFPTSDCCFDL